MSVVFYIKNGVSSIEDFDLVFRFYRKICFVCTTKDQLECIKNQFLNWMETHEFPIDASFNLVDDIHRNENYWGFNL